MRVLDVGCSDAAIGLWLAQQLDGTPLHVDGLDLDPNMVAKAQQRSTEHGLPGVFKHGSALDAPALFDPGSYQAVVSYEVIEHVPDVDAYLTALEQMLAPGGRIYLSTPDTTFGSGSNPHHLRVYRAVDLADALRRRGQLVDMAVGSDRVAIASYTPGPRLDDIGIYLGQCWNRWSPTDIETKGLGGSETAAVRLAEALSALGFVVTVYGDCDEMCRLDVIYRHWTAFDPLDRRGGLICSRIPEIGDRPIAAATRLLWLHDTDCGDRLTPARLERFDHILGLSRWHVDHLKGCYPWAADKLLQTRNGISPQSFRPQPWKDREQRVVYSSSPDRGLDHLLELWPRVREQAPDADLVYCYPDVYDAVADQDPVVAKHRDRIRALADQPGVTALGSLSQPALADLLCHSRVWAHPSYASMHDQPFHETSCLAAAEAQAAGCHVVASDWGALRETVQVGARVNNGALSDAWKSAFVAEIVAGLTDRKVGEHATTAGPEHAKGLGWDGVAVQIGKLIAAGDPAPGAGKAAAKVGGSRA